MVRAALYARVSSRDQATIPDQLADLRDYCEREKWKVAAEFSDVISGRRNTRPQRDKLIKETYKGRYDVVLVWKLDRWSRNVLDALMTVAELTRLNVAFVSYREKLDLTTPTGRAMAQMIAVFAELEREMIVDRIKSGVQKAREKGKKFGRPATAQEHALEVIEYRAQGKSHNEIAGILGISRRSVQRILEAQQ